MDNGKDLEYFVARDHFGRSHVFNRHTNPIHFQSYRADCGYDLPESGPPKEHVAAMQKWKEEYARADLFGNDGTHYGNCNQLTTEALAAASESTKLTPHSRAVAAEHLQIARDCAQAGKKRSEYFVEFKRPGNKLTLEQLSETATLFKDFAAQGKHPMAAFMDEQVAYMQRIHKEARELRTIEVPIHGSRTVLKVGPRSSKKDFARAEFELARDLNRNFEDQRMNPNYMHKQWVNWYALNEMQKQQERSPEKKKENRWASLFQIRPRLRERER